MPAERTINPALSARSEAQSAGLTNNKTRSGFFWPPSNILAISIICILGVSLWFGCRNADFIKFDDLIHVDPRVLDLSFHDVFLKAPLQTYFPVTTLSYQFDRAAFSGWLPTWAMGARFMNYIYHSAAALLLWCIMLELGLTRLQSLFVAAVFAAHPMGCESVCWISERKNILAALFGFAALLAWLKLEHSNWRIAATSCLYTLALMSKPSALGLLPVFVLIELFGGRNGLAGRAPMNWTQRPSWWLYTLLRIAALAALSAGSILMNLHTATQSLIKPPGGSAFTALLTDLEIFVRYIGNLLAPFSLSFIYFVEPICSLSDPRVYEYGFALMIIIAATVWIASNRRRAAFGWLLFLSTLGPNSNFLAAIAFLMQDRFVYLGTGSFFLVVLETFLGIRARFLDAHGKPFSFPLPCSSRLSMSVGVVYICVLVILSSMRGMLWNDALALFHDAEIKQPQSGFPHFYVGESYATAGKKLLKIPGADKREIAAVYAMWQVEWHKSLECTI